MPSSEHKMPTDAKYGTFDPNGNLELQPPITNSSPRRKCREFTRFIRILLITFALCIAALFSLGLAILGNGASILSPPFSTPPKDWSGFTEQSWAVGIDLSAGYATASVAFDNGTVVEVAMVRGGERYDEVLGRLALGSSWHDTPPYYDRNKQWRDLGRQWERYLRKKAGYAASPDVEALASPLSELQLLVNRWLRARGLDEVQVVFLTVPYLPALYMEDLLDAAENVGLQVLTLPWYIFRSGDSAQWPVSHINSAMAGLGLGLDDVFHFESSGRSVGIGNGGEGEGEEEKPWSDNLFSVLFTEQALTAHVGPFSEAPHFFAAGGVANFSLGLASLSSKLNETYWMEIRQELRNALDSYLDRGHELGRVIVHGEDADDEVFERILREEVEAAQWSGGEEREVQWFVGDEWAASRGASVFGNWCQRGLGKGDKSGCFPDLRPRAPGW